MSDWTIRDELVSGYVVYDALGMRLGNVTGCVVNPDDECRMLKVTLADGVDVTDYLVPIGAVTHVDEAASVQLGELTKQSIRRLCLRYDGELPERRLLVSLQRHFPPPSSAVLERLAGKSGKPARARGTLSWTRLVDILPR